MFRPERKLVRKMPVLSQVQDWVKQAKSLPRVMSDQDLAHTAEHKQHFHATRRHRGGEPARQGRPFAA